MSPASLRRSAFSSLRKPISSGDNAAGVETFLPGILIMNHQVSTVIAANAPVTRRKENRTPRSGDCCTATAADGEFIGFGQACQFRRVSRFSCGNAEHTE